MTSLFAESEKVGQAIATSSKAQNFQGSDPLQWRAWLPVRQPQPPLLWVRFLKGQAFPCRSYQLAQLSVDQQKAVRCVPCLFKVRTSCAKVKPAVSVESKKNRAGCRGHMCVAELMSDEKEMLKVACGIAVAGFKSEEEQKRHVGGSLALAGLPFSFACETCKTDW